MDSSITRTQSLRVLQYPFRWRGNTYENRGGKARSSRLADFSAILSVSNYVLHTHTHTYVDTHEMAIYPEGV